ncbi:MAG: hypothetical protein HY332_16705 [Chloroflexi bacterium]|nr:hypothetical protein [Chloroflexota bacterium]
MATTSVMEEAATSGATTSQPPVGEQELKLPREVAAAAPGLRTFVGP